MPTQDSEKTKQQLIDELEACRQRAARLEGAEKARHDAEEALRQSEERFRQTFEQAAVGIAHVAPDGHFLRVNQRFCDIVGYTHDEMKALTFQDITHPDDLDADLEQVQQLLAGERSTYSLEKRYIRKDGQPTWILLTVSLVRDASGEPSYFISVIEDISDRKATERRLLRSEEHYRVLAEASPDMIFVIDRDDTVRYVNPVAAERFGVDADEIVGAPRDELFPPAVSAGQRRGLQHVFESGERVHAESRVPFPDGEAWLSTWLVPIASNEEVEAVLGISRDITDRRRAEHALNERIKELTCLYAVQQDIQTDPAPGALCQRTVQHLVTAMEFPELTVPVVELDGERFTTDRYAEDLSHGLRAPIKVLGETRGRVSVYYTEERPFLLPEEQAMVDSVAETLALWLERRETSEEMARIFHMSLDLICVADMETASFTKVNPAFTETLGYSEEELLSRSFLEFIHPDDIEPTDAVIAEELSRGKKVVSFENRYRHKDGGYRWLDWVSHPEPESGRIYAVARDVTEQKRREQELERHRERLEEMVEERTRTIQQQTEEILELSTPTLKVMEGIVVVPLIGTLDSRRAQQFMDVLLNEVSRADAVVAIVDITGVPTIDTQTAQHLIEAVAAVRLLGARVVLTGVRPSIAQSLVHLGIDLSGLTTRSSLASGLRVAQGMVEEPGVAQAI